MSMAEMSLCNCCREFWARSTPEEFTEEYTRKMLNHIACCESCLKWWDRVQEALLSGEIESGEWVP